MRRFFLVACLAALCAATGCSPVAILADGVEQGYKETLVEYEAIVIDGKPRPNFSENDKQIRRNSLKKVQQLLDDARK